MVAAGYDIADIRTCCCEELPLRMTAFCAPTDLLRTEVQVGVHSALANKIAHNLLQQRRIASLLPYNTVRTEVTVTRDINKKRSLQACRAGSGQKGGKARLDFQLEGDDGLMFLEVKSVTMTQRMSTIPRYGESLHPAQ